MSLQHVDVCQAIVEVLPWTDEAWASRELDLSRSGYRSVGWKFTPEMRPFGVVLIAELRDANGAKTFHMKGLKRGLTVLAQRGVGSHAGSIVRGNVTFTFLLQHNDEREPRWVDAGRAILPYGADRRRNE